eukprot:2164995-Karenia_brevis.AAC.1
MSSYFEQSGRRFWVESERASSHSSSLGSQDEDEKVEMVGDRGYQLQRSNHEQSGRSFGGAGEKSIAHTKPLMTQMAKQGVGGKPETMWRRGESGVD